MKLQRKVVEKLKRVFPDKDVSIEWRWNNFDNEFEESWMLHVHDISLVKFKSFSELWDFANILAKENEPLISVIKDDSNIDPFKGHEPSVKNGNYRGD